MPEFKYIILLLISLYTGCFFAIRKLKSEQSIEILQWVGFILSLLMTYFILVFITSMAFDYDKAMSIPT